MRSRIKREQLETKLKSLKGTLIGIGTGIGARVLLDNNLPQIYEAFSQKLSKAALVANAPISEMANPNTDYIMSHMYTLAPLVLTGAAIGLFYDAFFNKKNK